MIHFNEQDIKALHDIDIETVIVGYGLEKQRNNKYLCPFHDDHEPSMILNNRKNRCECYVCNKKWDTIEFVKDIENCSFTEALIKLIKISGGNIGDYVVEKTETMCRRLKKEEKLLLGINVSDGMSVVPQKPVKSWVVQRIDAECVPNFNNDIESGYYDGYLVLDKSKLSENYLYDKFSDIYVGYIHERLALAIEHTRKRYEKGEDVQKEIAILNTLKKDFGYSKEKKPD